MPQVIGSRYEISDQIGAGGMGRVFRGRDSQTDQSVAIKQLNADLSSPELIERFKREGEALRDLNHPNIIKMLDAIEQDGAHYLVMEYVPGGDLNKLLKNESLSITRILQIMLDLADALTRAHRLGIIHRDLKPANVLISQDGTPRLTDFGVAHIAQKERVTGTGIAVGTVDYLAPEALSGADADARADIWSFGVMLFEMLVGKRPFERDSTSQTLYAIISEPVPELETLRTDAPLALVDLVNRMLDKNRESRIPSIRLVGAELEAILQARPISKPNSAPVSVFTSAPATVFVAGPRFETPPSSANQRKHNLPVQTTHFVEREAELGELRARLTDQSIHILTIVAPGGMGKTRLALEIAARFVAEPADMHFPDGVWFVSLAALTDPDAILTTLADAVGIVLPPDSRLHQRIILDYFRDKSILLIFDNFEHLLAGAPIVSDLVSAAPKVRALATSRERLNLQGESVLRLEGLEVPESANSESVLQFSAVKLFVQSAKTLRPDFDPNPDEIEAVIRICRLVDGLPLGLVLAASWIEVLTPNEIADEIARSLDFLETDMRDTPVRQRSIRAVFDYSWRLLSEPEQAVMMRLSVFRGGFTREAAAEVSGATLRILAALVNKSLLRRDAATGRYDLHELVRQYAAERLDEAGQTDATRNKHLDYYGTIVVAIVDNFEKGLVSPASLVVQFLADYSNFRAAQAWAYESGSFEGGLRIASVMGFGGLFVGYRLEGLSGLVIGLEHTEGATPLRAEAYQSASMLAGLSGDPRSMQFMQQSRIYAEQLGMTDLLAYQDVVMAVYLSRDYAQSLILLERAIGVLRTLNTSSLAICLRMYGDRARVQGDFERAERLYRETIEVVLARRLFGVDVTALDGLGLLAIYREDYSEAAKLIDEAIQKSTHQMGAARSVAADYIIHLGIVEHYRANWAEARRVLDEALTLFRDLNNPVGVAHALHRLAYLRLSQNADVDAIRYLTECLTVVRSSSFAFQFPEFSIIRLLILARLATRRDDLAEAVRLLGSMDALRNREGYPLEPFPRHDFEATLADLRERLSETDFDAGWNVGQQMDESAALAYAWEYLTRLKR